MKLQDDMRLQAQMVGFALLLSGCGGGGGGTDAITPNPAPNPPSVVSYSIGGAVDGVSGPGLVLQLNGSNDLAIDVARGFVFASPLNSGTSYQVSVKTNPVGQLCSVGNATGVATSNVNNIAVSCTTPTPTAPNAFKLGGSVSGLQGSGLVLHSGAQELAVPAASTTFIFADTLTSGSSYAVTVATQPTDPAQTCIVTNGMGSVGTADITNVSVSCVTPAPSPVGGLSLDQTELIFEGEEGQSVASKTLSGSISGATDPVYITITFTDSGLMFAGFYSTGPFSGELRVTPRQPGNIAPGAYHDMITVKACYDAACMRPVSGSPKSVPVTYTVRPPSPAPVLRLSDHGVAFALVPGASQLSRALVIRDSSSSAFGWTATSSAAWLSATGSGVSGGTLQLAANPAGLSEGFHDAVVTVSADNPAITEVQTVRVGLYVSAAPSASSFIAPVASPILGIEDVSHAVDPIRPLVYSSAGSTIAANHVHSGVRAGTLTVPGAELGGLAISDDGNRLYALNYASNTVLVVNLDTLAVASSYGFPQLRLPGDALKRSRIHFARVHGQPTLLMTNANQPIGDTSRTMTPVFKAETGEMVGELFGVAAWEFTRLAVSRDGTTAYVADAGISGVLSTTRVELRANSVGNLYGKAVALTQGVNEAALQDLATNADGSRVLVGYGTDHFVREAIFDGTSLQWTAGLSEFTMPSNVQSNGMSPADIEFDAYGKLFIHDYNYDLRLYEASGSVSQEWLNLADTALVSGASGSMRISSDGLRLIGGGMLLNIQP